MCGIVGMFQLKKDSQEQRERILELSKRPRLVRNLLWGQCDPSPREINNRRPAIWWTTSLQS